MINKTKGLAVEFFNKVYGAGNKKILLWGIGFALFPFVFGVFARLLIELNYLISLLATKIVYWISTAHIFSFSTSVSIWEHIGIVSWPLDRVIGAMSSPFADFLMIISFCFVPILAAMVLIKTKGQNLAALFITSMSLILTYALIFVG